VVQVDIDALVHMSNVRATSNFDEAATAFVLSQSELVTGLDFARDELRAVLGTLMSHASTCFGEWFVSTDISDATVLSSASPLAVT